ncbi:DUF5626 family protein [Bacillus sp. JJ722]|uniref:DUF5626 family protein n=1 Tax=Bacillus sp. JJ722 TaxID=3122973 RepID=UPI002FFF53E3
MKKTVLSLLALILLCSLGSINSYAAENEAEYDLNQGGTQQFVLIDEDGEEVIVTIEDEEEEPSFLSLRAVQNGTYKIASEKAGSWKASYNIVVSGNKITNAKNPSAIAYSGSFISKNLKVDSSKQATYYLVKKTGLLSSNINLRATLKKDSIVVTS